LAKAAGRKRPAAFFWSIACLVFNDPEYCDPLRNVNERKVQIANDNEQVVGVVEMDYASKAYAKVAKETAAPRELEASLLLKAAAKLQAVRDAWRDKPAGLHDALMYNRRLWMVFIDAVQHEGNKLPVMVRDNLTKLGAFVIGETFALMTEPKPNHLDSIIKINRGIAAGLRGKN
jgi:flagellar protein FlaF